MFMAGSPSFLNAINKLSREWLQGACHSGTSVQIYWRPRFHPHAAALLWAPFLNKGQLQYISDDPDYDLDY